MSTTFLQLTNRVLKALNEVELTSGEFASVVGFPAEVKDAVNMAIVDVYTEENNEWPFAWQEITLNTTIGVNKYTLSTSVTTADWESFRISRPQVTVTSITQAAGTATCTTASAHYLTTDEVAYIYGADQSAYNGQHTVTVTSSTTFTFSVDSSTTSPATGTMYVYPNWDEEWLECIPYDQYRQQYLAKDRNTINPDGYSKPQFVVRTNDNNIIISPKPDKVYPIIYEGFIVPEALDAHGDTIDIPDIFIQMIVDKAMHYAYMFRDNLEQANYAEDRYRSNVNKNRRILINKPLYMRHL